jgi:ABC-type antimicrobial peptide transport system, ATPase component
MDILELKNVDRYYIVNNDKLYALKDINLKIREGEMLIVLGQSGSGKSTLINVMSGLDRASGGTILFMEKDLTKYSEIELEKYRRDEVGFIFQTYNLIPNLKVKENIELGARLDSKEDRVDIEELLETFELKQYKDKFPYQLSGGGKQRVAISRALAKKPRLLVCDEPTGALDEKNAVKVIKKLQEYNEKYGTTIIVITHNPIYAKAGHRAIYINNGSIVKEIVNEKMVMAEDLEFSTILGR